MLQASSTAWTALLMAWAGELEVRSLLERVRVRVEASLPRSAQGVEQPGPVGQRRCLSVPGSGAVGHSGSFGEEHGPSDMLTRICHTMPMADTSMVEVGDQGRLVIPAALRKELGISKGTRLVARAEHGALVLIPQDAIKARLRALAAGIPRSLADELISDRRHEAELEAKV